MRGKAIDAATIVSNVTQALHRRDDAAKSFDEMRPEIEKQLGPEMAQKAIEKLKSQTKVQIDDAFFGPAGAAAPIQQP